MHGDAGCAYNLGRAAISLAKGGFFYSWRLSNEQDRRRPQAPAFKVTDRDDEKATAGRIKTKSKVISAAEQARTQNRLWDS